MATPNTSKLFRGKHAFPIFILLVLTVIPLHNLFSSTQIMGHSHYTDSTFFMVKSIEKHIFEYHSLPLWSPFEYSGVPLLGHPETFFVSLPLFLLFLLKSNTILIINLTIIISFFLSGLGAYFLSYNFKKNREAAIIAAVVFMFNPAVFTFGLFGNISILIPLSLMPFALLFTHKAITGKNLIMYSLFAGTILALQIHAGGMIIFLYTFILISSYLMFNLLSKHFVNKAIKAGIIFFILILFTLGLSAVKLLPTFEFQDSSSRVSKFTYEEFLGGEGHYIQNIKEIFPNFVKGTKTLSVPPQFGVGSFLLILASFFWFAKKRVIFLFLVVLFSILLASNTFLTQFAYKVVPFFGNLKNIDRILVLVALSGSLLAGYGYQVIKSKIQKIKEITIKDKTLFYAVLGILLIELLILSPFPQTVVIAKDKSIPLLDSISEDKDLFRLHYFQTGSFDLSHVIGAHGKSSFILYDKGEITGGGTIWPQELGQYLFLAGQQQSTRLWGLLNVKYITSPKLATIPNTDFVWEGEVCEHCAPDLKRKEITHLYRNNDYLPRAYKVENAILVLGGSREVIYSLLLHPLFNSNNTVIISSKDLQEFSSDALSKYKGVFLSANPPPNDMQKLQQYHSQGGVVLPNIFEEKNSVSEIEIVGLLGNTTGVLSPTKITSFKGNDLVVDVKESGFLVLSEMFTLFPGWEAEINKEKIPLLRANGVITGLFINEPGPVSLSYHPPALKKGLWISTTTFIVLISLLSYLLYRTKMRKIK